MSKRDIDTYKELKISSMSSKELIVLMYESALNLMEEARDRIAARDVPGTHEKLDRCRSIFLHLLSTLNLEAGGELARKLSALYAYFIEKVTVADVTKDGRELNEIIPMVAGIKGAWQNMNLDGQTPGVSTKPVAESLQALSVEV